MSIDLYDGLLTTRMMRRFSDEPVSDDDVWACLRAAVQAPSGGNIQPYQFLVVTDPDTRAALGAIYLKAWQRYRPAVEAATPPFKDEGAARRHARNVAVSDELAHKLGSVPVHVLVLAPRISMELTDGDGPMDVGTVHASVYPAVQNLILAARARGLGTCLTTVYKIHEEEVLELLGIPDRYEVAALLPLGHPTGNWGVAARRPAEKLTSWERFGERRPAPAPPGP
jgi:nitroreductase